MRKHAIFTLVLIAGCLFVLGLSPVFAAERAGTQPTDNLIDAALHKQLTAYLNDITQWIISLDVGSGTLKGTDETNTSVFINGNFARVLMASYQITGNKAHLTEAIRWCDGLCEQQEHTTTATGEPAGFWSDLGPGRNIYFGDGGTAATALALGYRFADGKQKAVYLTAMENMARFVMHGCAADPQDKGREATRSWVIATGPNRGALGCGYYLGHLSIEPYTVSTATTGGAFFASLYAITDKSEYRDVARNATKWLLTIRKPDGEIPYILHGKTETQWPLDTMTYCTEAFVAADIHLKDAALREAMKKELRPSVEWLLKGQNADGSWGMLRSPDQQRSPRVVTLLSWYYRELEQDPRIADAVRKYCHFLLEPANSKAYGVKELVRTTGFVGLVIADLLKANCTF